MKAAKGRMSAVENRGMRLSGLILSLLRGVRGKLPRLLKAEAFAATNSPHNLRLFKAPWVHIQFSP